MQKVFKSFWLAPVISGILVFTAVCKIVFALAWICYIPLFIILLNRTAKQSFKTGFIFGVTISCLGFYWMIPGAERFTGYSMWYGVAVFLVSAIFLSLFWGLVIFCFSKLKTKTNDYRSFTINALLAAALFTIAEALLMFVSYGFPWFDFHSGNAITSNLFAIQPASIFGVHVLSFVVVFVNYMAAHIIAEKKWKKLIIPFAVALIYVFTGSLILLAFDNKVDDANECRVAILAENILPDIKWDDANGNMLVQQLLHMNAEATQLKPDIFLWSESAIPWTYKKDDDLVNEILKEAAPANATQILGINTEYKNNEVYNSAYCILPDGTVTGRYDKQYLLSLIEAPVNGTLIPFFSSKGFVERNDIMHAAPLQTAFGKAGIMICNESAVPSAAYSAVNKGAQFLFNMSNDGWFNDTYIVGLHFYNARLRAVETRKDVAIDCNNGYSGLIHASGRIAAQERSQEPFVKMVSVNPNSYSTIASSFPFLFVYLCVLVIAFLELSKFMQLKRKK